MTEGRLRFQVYEQQSLFKDKLKGEAVLNGEECVGGLIKSTELELINSKNSKIGTLKVLTLFSRSMLQSDQDPDEVCRNLFNISSFSNHSSQ